MRGTGNDGWGRRGEGAAESRERKNQKLKKKESGAGREPDRKGLGEARPGEPQGADVAQGNRRTKGREAERNVMYEKGAQTRKVVCG